MYSPVHTIKVDLSTYARRLKPARGTMGKYYIAHFDVILLFGAPELKAQIAWSENVSLGVAIFPRGIILIAILGGGKKVDIEHPLASQLVLIYRALGVQQRLLSRGDNLNLGL